jgi:CYTH domain-containing protein
MDKTSRTELHRTFLIEQLPEPLTRASVHIQLFDNYIANTRMRLRSLRDPKTKEWTFILQQRMHFAEQPHRTDLAEIFLNETEYERFKIFEGTEIRKNRYFHEFGGRDVEFDVYIGKLWGLNTLRVEFEDEETLREYEPPSFIFYEITGEEFFRGENLVNREFADVQTEVAKLDLPVRRLGEPAS